MRTLETDVKIYKRKYDDVTTYGIGTYHRKYIIKNPRLDEIGYVIDYGTKVDIDKKIEIELDDKQIFLTNDNLLCLTFHHVIVDLNTKVMYKCTASELTKLKPSSIKKIILSNIEE
jgi:hypothetical protein